MRRWMAILVGSIAVSLVIGIAGTAYAYHMDPFYSGGRGYMNGSIYSGCRGYWNNQSTSGSSPQNGNFTESRQCCGRCSYQSQNVTASQYGWCGRPNWCRRNP